MNEENKLTEKAGISKTKFSADLSLRINQALFDLLYYQLTPRPKLKQKLEQCFYELKNTSKTLNFNQLAKTAAKYEEYLQSTEDSPEEIILKVVEGLAQIEKKKNKLSTDDLPKKEDFKNQILAINKVLTASNYTNMTYSGNLLIADNDVDFLEAAELALRQKGYQVTITTDGREILKILAAQQIDLIMISQNLMQNNNFNLVWELRNKNFSQPVVILTDQAGENQPDLEFELGVEKKFDKSSDNSKLFRSIEHLLEGANIYKNKLVRDKLTAAYTRKYFLERAQEEKERFRRGGEEFSIALVDLDDFSLINNNYGHLTGDQLLKDFVKFLRANLRRIDQIYRLRADKFLLLFPNTKGEDACKVINRLKDKLQSTAFNYQGGEVTIAFSSGVARLNSKQQTVHDLLRQAKAALYNVKREQKGTNKLADSDLKLAARRLMLIAKTDNPIYKLITARLEKLNYQITYSDDLGQIKKLAQESPPQLVIVNLTEPKLTPEQLSSLLTTSPQVKTAQLIVFSAQDREYNFKPKVKKAVNTWLVKPFSLVELEDKLQSLA